MGSGIEEAQRIVSDGILLFDVSAGYLCVFHVENSLNCTLTYIPLYVYYT